MRIAIATNKDNNMIFTQKEYAPIGGKGEVAHFLAELESIKQDLLEIWEQLNDQDEGGSVEYDLPKE